MWDVSRALTVLLFTSEPTWIAMLPSAFMVNSVMGKQVLCLTTRGESR